jgi:CheY-like chemotaxis protein
MSKGGPIVIVEDDKDERFLYKTALKDLKVQNELVFFENGKEAFDYLKNTSDNPFVIICDMNMPKMDGLDLRERIHENTYLRRKSTPFVFRTGTVTRKDLIKAYDLTVQGFFEKTHDYHKLERQLKIIIDYWMEGLEPNTFLEC